MLKTVFRLFLAGATCFVAARTTAASDAFALQRLPSVTPVEARLNASDVWVVRGQDCTSGCCDNGGLGCCDNGGMGCCDNGGCCDSGCYDSCDYGLNYGCCGLPGAYVMLEATFFKYSRADGVPTQYDYEAAPRITLGYTADGGLGARLRYWDYNYSAGATHVETYNLDAEIYQRVCVGCKSTVEVSGGVRFNEFEETGIALAGATPVDFSGFGAMVAIEGTRKLRRGMVYARARGVMFVEDLKVDGIATLTDAMPSQTELTLGWRGMRCLNNGAIATLDLAVETQNWSNYTVSRFAPSTTDVGFFGVTAGVGLLY